MTHNQLTRNFRQHLCSFRHIGSPSLTMWSMWSMVILLSSPTYGQRPQNDVKPVLNVFLLAGQSNMAGADSEVAVPPGFQQTTADRDTLFTTAPLPDGEQSKQYVPWGEIRGHESKGKLVHGPEVGFARTLHAAGWRNLAIIKVHANFGRDVQDWPWSERGALFNDWTTFADARIAELVARGHTIRVRGFVWHQGIDDAIHGRLAGHYERNLSDLISVLRKRYADEHAPFLLARSVNSRIAQPNPNAGDGSPLAVVRRSQVNVGKSVPFAAWIDVDDLPNVNTHHFSADSQLVIGKRFGDAFLKFQNHAVEVTVTSPLPKGNLPMDPAIDCGQVIREHGGSGVLDPNSFEVINLATGKPAPFARSEDFAYGDRGRLEWVVTDPTHTKFEVRFRSVAERPALEPPDYTPLIGVGDLLRYNAGQPRPFALPFPARLVDLTGDGKLDLVGCWNYAYRPGWPWDGIVCYPRVGDPERFEFGDLTRIRFVKGPESTDFQHFINIYMTADVDFVDFDGDGLIDLVWRPATGDRLNFYRNTGRRDAGGMPVFVEAGSVAIGAGGPVRVIDLDDDGAPDVIVGDVWLRNTKVGGFPPTFAPPARLGVPGLQCWFDVDQDRKLDAIIRENVSGEVPDNIWSLCDRIAWRRNSGGDPPKFGAAAPLAAINAHAGNPQYVTAANDGGKCGLLVTDWPNLTVSFYEQIGPVRFRPPALAQSKSAVISLGDQAWPHLCDWNDNGVLDLLVGGGYGWPQIVINEGTNQRPAWGEPQLVLADGKPIRLTRNEILGGEHGHDMGYPYPAYVDWDGDGLPDLVVPNETNRIFWYQNIGTRKQPKFGPRQQVLCEGFPDSPEARLLSAKRASENQATEHATGKRYPEEADQPFFWRTGAAFADFNGDRLMDMVTYDGAKRIATLFVQSRGDDRKLGLKKQGALATSDGKPIDAYGHLGHLTKAFRAVDWDGDGLVDLMHSTAGTWVAGAGRYSIGGVPGGTSIHLLRNVGTRSEPKFAPPRPMLSYGEPIAMTHHGPHPWAGDLDGDGKPDLVTCVEWSVYPFYSHHALEMPQRPSFTVKTWVARDSEQADQSPRKP